MFWFLAWLRFGFGVLVVLRCVCCALGLGVLMSAGLVLHLLRFVALGVCFGLLVLVPWCVLFCACFVCLWFGV